MKKILPIVVGIILLLAAFYLLTVYKTSSTPYSDTNPGKYDTTPSPASTNLTTYTNDSYRFTLEYPVKGIDPQEKVINCGKFISENNTLFSPNNAIVVDNIAIIEIQNWNKSIEEYIDSQSAKGLYNMTKIMASGADEAVKIDGLKQPWTGEGYIPMGYTADIYQKDGKLFLVQNQQNYGNNGCINPEGVNNAPSAIDTTWRIEDHLRFY